MLYLNQTEYRHITYHHSINYGGAPMDRRNIATSGCGICCLSMIVDHLTTKHLSITECVQYSYDSGANKGVGTNLKILAPVICELFDMDYDTTNDLETLLSHLHDGGEAIANVCGDYDDHIGLFSHKGHYIVIVSTDGKNVCILDPSYKEGKFDENGRQGKVTIQEPFLYCSITDLTADVLHRNPSFYLFKRKQ